MLTKTQQIFPILMDIKWKMKDLDLCLKQIDSIMEEPEEEIRTHTNDYQPYIPPFDSTGDADYLKEVPNKLKQYNA